MATYLYETIPQRAGEQPRRFEVIQSMKDAAFTRHPDTGEPVRRLVTGGYGLMGVGTKHTPAPDAGHSHSGGGCGCGGSCGCGHCS